MREWKEPEGWLATPEEEEDLGLTVPREEVEAELEECVQIGTELTPDQLKETVTLVQSFQDVFQEEPGWAEEISHEIHMPKGAIV